MRARRLWAVVTIVLAGATGAAPDDAIEADLKVVGRSDLGTPAVFADVTVVGTTVVAATHSPAGPCAGASAAVLAVKDPKKPAVVATIPMAPGTMVLDLDSTSVLSPAFTGDVVAVATGRCAGGDPLTVDIYDVTDPPAPRRLAQRPGAASVSLAQRIDGRAVAVRATEAGVAVDDLSDPAAPVELARWTAATPAGGCGTPAVQLYEDGTRAVAAVGGGVYAVDLADPASVTANGPAEGARAPAGVLPLGNRTVAVLAEDGGCPPGEPGLRVLVVNPGEVPVDAAPLRYAGAGAPRRLAASGSYAYVAWGAAGVRVVDFAEVRPKTVAQFAPAQGDVVAVALLPQHVVVADANQGIFVLERPDEGGGRATFWSQFTSLLPYLGFAVVMAAALLVPRMLASRAGATVRMPVPGAEPVRRRRRA